MTNLLILDTASSRCWVGLQYAGGLLLERSTESRRAAQQLLPMTERLLSKAQLVPAELTAIAVINGPGSFTGMRIGVGIAQGLAFAAQIPVVPISSLQALAASAAQEYGHSHWLIAEPARDEETYVGGYELERSGHCQALFPEQIVHGRTAPIFQSLADTNSMWGVAGDSTDWLCAALADCPLELRPAPDHGIIPASVCRLVAAELAAGNSVLPEATLPNYVKDQLDYS